MKVTHRQIKNFVFDLPTDVDYESNTYGKIVLDELDLEERLEKWLKSLGIEVIESWYRSDE